RQQLVDGADDLDAELGGRSGRERVVADEAHVEGGGAFGDLAADAAQADDAERLAGELAADELVALPLAAGRAGVGGGGEAAGGTRRQRASERAMVCSAALTVLPPGVFMTTIPLRVAAATSMLSTPTPARAIALSWPGFSSSSAVMRVALRTTAASAARRASA